MVSFACSIMKNIVVFSSGSRFAVKLICCADFGSALSACCLLKGTLSRLRQFLATESPFKVMKNAFYFTLKALFVLKVFKFLS